MVFAWPHGPGIFCFLPRRHDGPRPVARRAIHGVIALSVVDVVLLVLALVLGGYLLVALLHPEKF
jgi:K+-transporting ATPase KdpF subunit